MPPQFPARRAGSGQLRIRVHENQYSQLCGLGAEIYKVFRIVTILYLNVSMQILQHINFTLLTRRCQALYQQL